MRNKTEYRIYMESIGNHEEGWYCGSGSRSNDMYERSPIKNDADTFDDINALLLSVEFKRLGYPCKVMPKITKERQLEILT